MSRMKELATELGITNFSTPLSAEERAEAHAKAADAAAAMGLPVDVVRAVIDDVADES